MDCEATTFELSILDPQKEFDNFLGLPANDRIIFSGIYGSGKTFFLTRFFKEHKKFIPLFLYPTNYSVSQNEDIFELIKYDVLYEILKRNPSLNEVHLSAFQSFSFLNNKEIYLIFKSFINAVGALGKPVSAIIDSIEHLVNAIQKKQVDIGENEGLQIESFAKVIESSRGSIYENDFYTQLITSLIQRIRGKDQEVVLIVDDLDRIDPEHIFRIVNVFAAHFDTREKNELKIDNKFDLDRILLSCDIQNIRRIFSNRYGSDVDFNGYVDKFYSRHIFYFDNKLAIINEIISITESIEIKNNIECQWSNPNSNYRKILAYLLGSLVYSDLLNLRSLHRIFQLAYQVPKHRVFFGQINISNIKLPIVTIFDFLSFLFGGDISFGETVKKIRFIPLLESIFGVERLIADLVMIVDHKVHSFKSSEEIYRFTINSSVFEYQVHGENVHGGNFFCGVFRSSNLTFDMGELAELFQRSVEIYHKGKSKNVLK